MRVSTDLHAYCVDTLLQRRDSDGMDNWRWFRDMDYISIAVSPARKGKRLRRLSRLRGLPKLPAKKGIRKARPSKDAP